MGCDIHGIWQKKTAHGWQDIESNYEQDRHYELFAALAGVRNGYGFAGVPTGEAIIPASEPRGLPAGFKVKDFVHPVSDVSIIDPRRRRYRDDGDPLEFDMGDHSHSWLTGKEMLDWYASAPTVAKTGIITRKQFEEWDWKSCPETYCGGTSGPGIVIASSADKVLPANFTHVRVTWKQSLREELAYFFSEVKRLVDLHGEIRFVFGFDS